MLVVAKMNPRCFSLGKDDESLTKLGHARVLPHNISISPWAYVIGMTFLCLYNTIVLQCEYIRTMLEQYPNSTDYPYACNCINKNPS